jgi:predicted DNA-binding protein with PD1-like motif
MEWFLRKSTFRETKGGKVWHLRDGKPAVHAHAVIGKKDGTAHGGHLLEAHIRPTCEVILTESPIHLQKQIDPESGLVLIRP